MKALIHTNFANANEQVQLDAFIEKEEEHQKQMFIQWKNMSTNKQMFIQWKNMSKSSKHL
jgi:hypothetical protein